MFFSRSMQWKILHLLVCFEVRSDDFLVTSIFCRPAICLKPVLLIALHLRTWIVALTKFDQLAILCQLLHVTIDQLAFWGRN
jgi:hypothetical protein